MFGAGLPDARYRPGKEGVPPTFAFGASHDLLRPIPRKSTDDDSKSTLVPFDLRHYHLRTIIVRGDYHMYGLGAIYTKSKPLPSSQFNGIYKMQSPDYLYVQEGKVFTQNYLPFKDPVLLRAQPVKKFEAPIRCISLRHKWIDSTTLHILNRYHQIVMVLNFHHSETGPYFTGTRFYPSRGEFFE